MASNLAAADAVLKIGYGDIHDQLENFLVALKLVERGSKHLTSTNLEAQFAARMSRSQGIGARSESEDLPAAGAAKDARASLYLKYQYGAIEGTGQVFEQVSENTAAFVDWMRREMTDVIESANRDLNRQIYGNGTGTLALLTGAATAATVLTVDDVHWLEEGMTFDVLTAATLGNATPTSATVSGTVATIVSIDENANTVTLSGATITAAVGSALVRASYSSGARQNNWKKEWEGLGLIVSSATLHNINPATYPKWLPGYSESGVGDLAELKLTKLAQAIFKKGGKLTDFLTSYGVANSYWNQLQGLRRYDGGQGLKGGATVPVFQSVFGDVPFTLDPRAPEGTLYGLNKSELYVHSLGDWKWMDKTGAIWRQVGRKDAWEATFFQYSNIGTFRRNTHGVLSGITEVGV